MLRRLHLTGKIMLALVLVSLAGVAVAGVAYRLSLGPAFAQLVIDEAHERFEADVMAYYREHGTVDDIAAAFAPRGQSTSKPDQAPVDGAAGHGGAPSGAIRSSPPSSGPALGAPETTPRGDPLPVEFGLANRAGIVVLESDGYQRGQAAPAEALRAGKPIRVDGVLIGTSLPPRRPLPPSAAQRAYAARINRALGLAAAAGVSVAMLTSILLARSITRPLQRLTAAAAAVTARQPSASVPPGGCDEIGQLSRAFNTMSAEVERLERARQQLTAEIAHELRTPLTTVCGYIEAMRDGTLQPTPARLDSMFRQARRLAVMIDDLRLLSMANAGELPLRRSRVALGEIIDQCVQAHAVRARGRGVDLRTDIPPDTPTIEADPGRIQQAIDILVSNALRHTDQGEVVVSAGTDRDAAVIRVSDTGSGIEPDAIPHLFDPFYRGAAARKRDAQGSGLELAIARAIINAHGGTISVASQVQQGTMFTIALPREAA